ncbi:Glutathione gamma-glutamylcysteinyltransferase 1 [Rhynchospora pubera]|uniref:glutathione gamma-glutamylcysteinyltransferase n=1 Tax=Rhynchospora pubera TaxID=906938 RepID=A0AAV8E7P2_9POAL|nr:Glutathione gamma-glutamylcysteinyltransferase 1 [Rhynchospora pubera]
MAVAGLYRRILPSPPAIEFASCDGKRLFSEALQSGTMEGFFRLISYFQTQSEPAYCGLASLSVVLNALAIDPGRKWKGPWRWFDESMLDCCEPLEKVKAEGITFGKVACLAHCAGAKVEAYRANESNLEDFRKHVIKCTTSEDCHVIASYHRRPFQQTGTGHFSPLGGYHAGKDMALILDVARFKYPPHWVPLSLLWEAINTVDDATGLPRGFMLISRLPKAPSLLYTLSCRDDNWVKVAKYLREDVPKLVRSETVNSVQALFSLLFRTLPSSAGDFIKWVVEVRRQEEGVSSLSPEERERLNLKEEVLSHVRGTRLFKLVKEILSDPCCSYTKSPFGNDSSLQEIVATACCQGAALLTGNPHIMDQKMSCCKETCVNCVQSNTDETIVSGTVVVLGGNEQGVDVLLPVSGNPGWCGSDPSSCVVKYPASNDVLTVLLLALPPSTWSGVRDQNVLDELLSLLSTDTLPELLQLEILHLRKQMLYLGGCEEIQMNGATLP